MSDLFGWDLVYQVSEGSIKKKEDNLILLLHFLLIKNGFKCLGLGDANTSDSDEKGSELLPLGWSCSNCYSIRYRCSKQSFVLRGVPVNNSIVFNLLETTSLAVSNIALIADDEVKAVKGDLNTIFAHPNELMKKITDGLINPVNERLRNNCEATTQTSHSRTSVVARPHTDPIPDIVSPHRSGNSSGLLVDPLRDPLRVGGADLDPLGGLGGYADGGGMLFDPFSSRGRPDPHGLPRGSVPPGARFDPFGPPDAVPGPRRPPQRGPPDFDLMDPFGGSGARPFGGPGGPFGGSGGPFGGSGGPPMFM